MSAETVTSGTESHSLTRIALPLWGNQRDMAGKRRDGQACRVCGGTTEPAPPEPAEDVTNRREQRRCTSRDCAGRDWWVQLTQR